ncbi:MAG: DUF1007 family protein [Thiothrix sp.]|nr:DUF1007 family protein [Thiothrix sp.]HPE60244.1 DUF1007 family protein [Thiolinea sp.]
MNRKRHFGVVTALFALSTTLSAPVMADGLHFSMDVSTRLLADEAGRLRGLEMRWHYDRALTELILGEQDMSTPEKRDAVMAVLGHGIMADLFDMGYYTLLRANGEPQVFMNAPEYRASLAADQAIQLDFMLPLRQPLAVGGVTLQLELADPDAGLTLSYRNPARITLDPVLASRCSSPALTTRQQVLNAHQVDIQTVTLNCR